MRTKAELEKLLIDAGHAINANNGQCYVVEDVLCRVTSLCTDMLNSFERDESTVGLDHWSRAAAEEIHDALDDIEGEAGQEAQIMQQEGAGTFQWVTRVSEIIRKHTPTSEIVAELLAVLKLAARELGINDPNDLAFESNLAGAIRAAIARAEEH